MDSVNVDGSGAQGLAAPRFAPKSLHTSWSGDGSRIAVYSPLSNGVRHFGVMLFTMATDGSDKRTLVKAVQDQQGRIHGTTVIPAEAHGEPWAADMELSRPGPWIQQEPAHGGLSPTNGSSNGPTVRAQDPANLGSVSSQTRNPTNDLEYSQPLTELVDRIETAAEADAFGGSSQ